MRSISMRIPLKPSEKQDILASFLCCRCISVSCNRFAGSAPEDAPAAVLAVAGTGGASGELGVLGRNLRD